MWRPVARGVAAMSLVAWTVPVLAAGLPSRLLEPVGVAASAKAGIAGLIAKPRDAGARADEVDDATRRAGHARRQAAVTTALHRIGANRWRAVGPVGRLGQRIDFDQELDEAAARAAAARLEATGAFEWVVLNRYEQHQQVFPNDPLFTATLRGQWWLRQTPLTAGYAGVPDATTGWQRLFGSPTPPIAVLDTGITAHPDLGSSVRTGGYDLVSKDDFSADGQPGRDADPSDPGDALSASLAAVAPFVNEPACEVQDSSWHGTIITGVIGATTNNDIGVASINPFAHVLPVRVAARCGALQSDLIDGLRWAAGLQVSGLPLNPAPARVLNVSFGSVQACDASYQEAIDELARWKGAVVVAAAGNEANANGGAVIRPANCRGVVAVAALHAAGFKSSYSSFGAAVTVGTVGGDPGGTLSGDGGLVTVYNEGQTVPGAPSYAAHFGTSFAAPVVSGVVSMMLGLNPGLSTAQVITGLRSSARPHISQPGLATCGSGNTGQCNCSTDTCGAGIVDLPAALAYAAETPGIFSLPSSSGGGALGWNWALGLAAAIWGLSGAARRAGPRGTR